MCFSPEDCRNRSSEESDQWTSKGRRKDVERTSIFAPVPSGGILLNVISTVYNWVHHCFCKNCQNRLIAIAVADPSHLVREGRFFVGVIFLFGRFLGNFQIGYEFTILFAFLHNFCIKPYVPREPRRDSSNRWLYENGIWLYNISDTTRIRTHNQFHSKCTSNLLGQSESVTDTFRSSWKPEILFSAISVQNHEDNL